MAVSSSTVVRNHPLVRAMVLTMLVGAVALVLVGLLFGDKVTGILSLIGVVCFSASLALLRFGRPAAGVLLALACLLGTTFWAMWFGAGLHDVVVILLPVVILLGCLVLEPPYNLIPVALAVAAVVIVAVAEAWNVLPQDCTTLRTPADALISPVILAALGMLVRVFVDRIFASERSYREIFNATQEAIFIHDAETGTIVDVNDATLRLYGYSRSEISGLVLDDLSLSDESCPQGHTLAMIRLADVEGPQRFECVARRKDGTSFWVEVSLCRSSIGGQGRVLGVVRDIDTRKRAEESSRQADKLRSLGQLAGGVAHDFNNQLAGIAGFAQLIAFKAKAQPEVASHAQEIVAAASRASQLTGRLLAFARVRNARAELVDVNELVRDVVGLLERSIDPRIVLSTNLAAQAPIVRVSRSELHSAILNLGLNARDALPSGGSVTLETRRLLLAQGERAEAPDAAGEFVEIRVSDNGVGMNPTTRSRIFEPFFTTKPEGTGMGLSLVYALAKSNGGFVAVSSELGSGAVFSVFLPAQPGEAPAEAVPSSSPEKLGLRVLLAEDEPAVAYTTRILLEELGCDVLVTADGERAVAAYRADPDGFDVVLLDLTMPRLTGRDALAALRLLDGDARVVVTSGSASDAVVESLRNAGAMGFLGKPYGVAELRQALAKAARPTGGNRHPDLASSRNRH